MSSNEVGTSSCLVGW